MDLTKLLEALEKNSFPSVFQLLEVAHIPWLMNPFHLQSQQLHHSLSSVVTSPSLTLILLPLFSTNKDPVIILGHPDKLPSSGQLISSLPSAPIPLCMLCNIIIVPVIGAWTSLGSPRYFMQLRMDNSFEDSHVQQTKAGRDATGQTETVDFHCTC